MEILNFSPDRMRHIDLFDAKGASNIRIAGANGEGHVYALRIEPGGVIGAHPAGYDQLFLVVDGEGWVAGASGERVPLHAGQGAHFAPGEVHSKGSHSGMTVIMLQADTVEPDLASRRDHEVA